MFKKWVSSNVTIFSLLEAVNTFIIGSESNIQTKYKTYTYLSVSLNCIKTQLKIAFFSTKPV